MSFSVLRQNFAKSLRTMRSLSKGAYQRRTSSYGMGRLAIPPSEPGSRTRKGTRKDCSSRKSPPGILLAACRVLPWMPGG